MVDIKNKVTISYKLMVKFDRSNIRNIKAIVNMYSNFKAKNMG